MKQALLVLLSMFLVSCDLGTTSVPKLHAAMSGRCIRTTTSLYLVEQGDPDEPGAVFLSTDKHSESAVREIVPAGAEFTIIEVLHERSFEYSIVRIVGRSEDGRIPRVGLSLLFDVQWKLRAEQFASGSIESMPRVEPALKSELALWCEEMPK
ncbi:MAG: hypothetical protein ACREQV_10885 [Candidatus Binatia bacterium]